MPYTYFIPLLNKQGGGIGREVVKSLVQNGVNTVFCADINTEAAQRTAEACTELVGPQSVSLQFPVVYVDVTDEDSVIAMFELVRKAGRLDHFVNASGNVDPSVTPITNITLKQYRAMDENHNIATFLCIREALKAMKEQELKAVPMGMRESTSRQRQSRGSVTILTSLASEGGFPGKAHYVAAKHACSGLIQTAGKVVQSNAQLQKAAILLTVHTSP